MKRRLLLSPVAILVATIAVLAALAGAADSPDGAPGSSSPSGTISARPAGILVPARDPLRVLPGGTITPRHRALARPSAGPDRAPSAGCRAGNVALTFDDGPSTSVTAALTRELLKLHVPATFFMVGSRIDAAPEVARLVARRGFTIGNHTYAHRDLTTQTDDDIRAGLIATSRALRRAGVREHSAFVRPPYGATDARVARVLRGMGLTSVLWDVDSRDWAGRSTTMIARSVIAQVRARGRAGSVVLQHDGVTNSPATLAAVPHEVHALRRLGFCFVGLDAAGEPAS
ncbi:hypothetical protein GCM10022215_18980 [Nocardioides fonticola]|uniref:NodB homology domain-containing protein n=1 Tax=Nocardioides fonticola TaxID=450363 RepID=A0ABP7XHV8_9ACTN